MSPGARIALALGVAAGVIATIAVIARRSRGLAGPSDDRAMAERSLVEEERAIADYGARAQAAADPELRRLFLHNQAEEATHAQHLRRYLRA